MGGKRASWYEVRKEDSDEEEECELCTWVQMNDITCPVCLQREEDMTDLMKHIMFAHDSEEFGNICQECLDEAPWESDSEEVFNGEVSDEEVPEERNETEKSKSPIEDNSSERADGTPLGETDKEAYSTDEGFVATDDDEEEVDKKGEKPKSKNASKIPRIIVTDDDRREHVEKEPEVARKSNNMTRIPRRHHK